MPSKPGKRPRAEDVVRDFDAQRAGHAASTSDKKPRFDARNPSTLAQTDEDNAPDGDADAAILELDEIGRSGNQTKRNAVRLEGYESDSSNEGFDGRAAEKARAQKTKAKAKKDEEDDDDMFAEAQADLEEDADDDFEAVKNKKQSKEVRFMDTGDIEGQVASSKGGGHVSADFRAYSDRDSHGKSKARATSDSDDDSSSASDEERDRSDGVDAELGAGSKKSRAPKLDAFNMRNEAEEGRFDEAGNFVRKAADPFAIHDSWMEGNTSRAAVKRAREAHEKREMQRRQRDMADDAVPTSDILAALIRELEMGETALEALARYAPKGKKAKPRWQTQQKSKSSTGMDVDQEPSGNGKAEDAKEQARKQAIDNITAAADQLLTRGQQEVYDTERELLMRQYKQETGEDWRDERAAQTDKHDDATPATKQWEFQWASGRDGGQVHGPYDSTTMAGWQAEGYFAQGVQFREAGASTWRDALPEFD